MPQPDGNLLVSQGPVAFEGMICQRKDVSGLADTTQGLWIGSDEPTRGRNVIQFLRRKTPDHFEAEGEPLVLSEKGELDLEAIATQGRDVYVIGSHALSRSRIDEHQTYEKNRDRLLAIDDDRLREKCRLIRCRPSRNDTTWKVDSVSLLKIFRKDPYLSRFCRIPSKENGIDIEGLAIRGEECHIGFRGPVLRGGWGIVMSFPVGKPKKYRLNFLPLGGDGIRDLASEGEWLLVLSGPVGSSKTPFRLWAWNGLDLLPGEGHPPGALIPLGEFPNLGKAEGIAVTGRSLHALEVLVVFDGEKNGGPHRFEVPWNREQLLQRSIETTVANDGD